MATYYFGGNEYHYFADLENAYWTAKGCFPAPAYEVRQVESTYHFFYR